MTHVLSEKVSLAIVVLVDANVATLEAQGAEAPDVLVLAADRIAGSDTNASVLVVRGVDVEPQDVLARAVVLDDLGSLDDAVGAQVAGLLGAGDELSLKAPLDQIRGGVAVDGLERRAAGLLLADHVVDAILLAKPSQWIYA